MAYAQTFSIEVSSLWVSSRSCLSRRSWEVRALTLRTGTVFRPAFFAARTRHSPRMMVLSWLFDVIRKTDIELVD